MAKLPNVVVVGEAVRITAEHLGPWIDARIDAWPPDRNGRMTPHDPWYLVGVLKDQWLAVFKKELGEKNHALVYQYGEVRNRAMHNHPFDDEETRADVETCRRLLRAIASDERLTPERAVPRVSSGRTQHRRAASAEYRQELWNTRFDPHIEPINRLVDELITEQRGSWMPYVAPNHGGTNAKIVTLFQDPGKMTSRQHGGSGFIGVENDDPTANLLADCLDEAGVAQSMILPWNSYPWYLTDQGNVTATRRDQGVAALRRLLDLAPEVHTVVSHGAVAHDTWKRFGKRFPSVATRYRHLETFHTSGRGITNGGQQTKAEGVAHVVATLRSAAQII